MLILENQEIGVQKWQGGGEDVRRRRIGVRDYWVLEGRARADKSALLNELIFNNQQRGVQKWQGAERGGGGVRSVSRKRRQYGG